MKALNYKQPKDFDKILLAAEPEVLYIKNTKPQEFLIDDFELLQRNIPFNLAEWADILHLSDRTLQRYIKEGKPFEGLHSEHLHQLKNMSELGVLIFKTSNLFKEWLMKSKNILGNTLDFNSLKSFWGVKLISSELGRIAYGVYI